MLSELLSLTGMPSPGKSRLAVALQAAGLSIAKSGAGLRVHAETDLEALLDPRLARSTRADAAAADLVVAVDWEPTARSVGRIVELVRSRTALAPPEEAA